MTVDEYAQARPSPALRPYVAFYSGYRQRGLPAGTHRGLPSPYLTLILTIDEPLVIAAHPDRRQAPGRYDALIGGLHLSPALITMDGASRPPSSRPWTCSRPSCATATRRPERADAIDAQLRGRAEGDNRSPGAGADPEKTVASTCRSRSGGG